MADADVDVASNSKLPGTGEEGVARRSLPSHSEDEDYLDHFQDYYDISDDDEEEDNWEEEEEEEVDEEEEELDEAARKKALKKHKCQKKVRPSQEEEEEEEEEEDEEEEEEVAQRRMSLKMIDILNPPRKLLPVILPPIGDARKAKYAEAWAERKAAVMAPPTVTTKEEEKLQKAYKRVIWRAQNGLHINNLQKVSRKLRTEYVMQRKEVYYLRRAIKARKIALAMIAQTRKFEEACLEDYEWLTEFTQECFEKFLRQNDNKISDASRRADQMLKEKVEKTAQVDQLTAEIEKVKADIGVTNENLRECKGYMEFLDNIAKEIMKKEEEEEIRAHHREQQVKEELMELLKEGVSLRKAEEMVEEKAKKVYEEYAENDRRRMIGAPGLESGSKEFLLAMHKEIRGHLGLPEEPLSLPSDDHDADKSKPEVVTLVDNRKKSGFDEDHDSPPLPVASIVSIFEDDEEEEEEVISPDAIVQNLVQRNKSRLLKVVGSKEKSLFELMLTSGGLDEDEEDEGGAEEIEDPIKRRKSRKSNTTVPADVDAVVEYRRPSIPEDDGGFNEAELIRSLNLVPGDEDSDRREIANLSFTSPSQLLQIYQDLEESNLSLVQHSQTSEEMLERVQHQIINTRKQLTHQGRLLREGITNMQENIDAHEERAQALTKLVEMFTGGNYDVRKQQRLYRLLQLHIGKVYKAAIGASDEHLNPIMMLTSIEKNFEELMQEIQSMPPEVVVQITRELDKERREMERMDRMNKRKVAQEERESKAFVRATAPIHRRKGRPLLARSHPKKAVIHLSQAELEKKAEEDEFNYFFGA